ncbi:MAG TPA: carboxypeptidase regulatory-like domain-containing protein [Terriglobales bacterium]|nr:carboxypeptidase regulatory-like domain-containing protein [Terriglobales bacterium]
MEYAFRNTLTRFMLVLGVLALLSGIVWAQGTSELTGLVTDPTGAVVANVTVNLVNTATGEKRSTVTTPAGVYRFTALPVSTYTLEMAAKGFKSVKVAGIVTSVGTTVTRDVKLELGATSEQVTVEAGAEVVQTTESDLSQLVDRNTWQNMPLQIRNQNSFIELVAGAVPQDGSGQNRGAVVNGTRGGTGSYLVEGMDNNEQGQAGRGQISIYDKGGAATSISPDAIQEYRVITNSYSAEYGKGGGFITDTVLKSGTNDWHGSAFEYNRVQALAGNDWFSTRAGIQDSLVRNQFGGSLGGPIIKDKTFWYGVGELHRVRQAYPIGPVTATTQQFLDFVQSGGLQQWAEGTGIYGPGTQFPGVCLSVLDAPCPGAFTNSSTLGPIFTTLHNNPAMHYPLVNDTTTDCLTNPAPCTGHGIWSAGLAPNPARGIFPGGTPTLVYPVPLYDPLTLSDSTAQNEARFSVKVDHHFSANDTLSGFYDFQDATYTDPFLGGANSIGPTYIQDGRGQVLGLTWNHTFTPTLLNTFKAGYLRHKLNFPPAQGTYGIPSYYTVDGMGADLGLYPGLPQFFTDNQFQYLDTLSIVHGKHSIKAGGEYRRTRNGSSFFNGQFGFVLPWGVEDVMTDLNFSNEADLGLTGGGYYGGAYYLQAAVDSTNSQAPILYRGYRANELAGFVQDDWRVSNRLTLNLGLRWEYFGPPHNFKAGIDSNAYFGTNVTPIVNPNTGDPCNDPTTGNIFCPVNNKFYAGVATEAFQVRNAGIWNKDTNNFSPRVGFAWDVLGTQKLVVRAGFGIMYDRIYNNTFENIRFNPPYFSLNTVFFYGPLTTPGPGQPNLFSYPFTTRALFNDPAFTPLPNPRHMDQNIVAPYYEQTHFGFQWEFAKGYVFEPEYVGTFGHKLTGFSDANTFDGRVAGVGAGSSDRLNPNIGADNFRSNGFASNYHAFQATVRKTYSAGLSFNANYTFSHALDEHSDLFLDRSTAGGRPTDNMNFHADYGNADFDTRHRAVVALSYDLPFAKTNRWLGGWGVNTIVSYQTGHPFTPYSSSRAYDLNKDGYRTDRLVTAGGVNPQSTVLSGSALHDCINNPEIGGRCYFDKTQWMRATCPPTVHGGLWCDAPIGRNSLFGPSFANVDFNVTKAFKVTERFKLTFQANFFDLFNHPNFLPPTTAQNSSNVNFGQLTATAGDGGGHRVTQMALRLDF